MNMGFQLSLLLHVFKAFVTQVFAAPFTRFVDMSDNMSWRCMDFDDDGQITSEGQGETSPYMLLIMQQMGKLMKQRQEEDAAEAAAKNLETMDKSKDVASSSKEIEDDLKGGDPQSSSTSVPTPTSKKAKKTKKNKKWPCDQWRSHTC